MYDGNGNPTNITDRKNQATGTTCEAVDGRTPATYADGSMTVHTYYAGDRLTQVTDSIGGITTFTWDGLEPERRPAIHRLHHPYSLFAHTGGGLLSYGPNLATVLREHMPALIDKIVKGDQPD